METPPDSSRFDHERLDVYREAIRFVSWISDLLSANETRAAARDQLDRASTSIALNIAEGNGKRSARDRARYFEIARGSALECAACLDVLVAKGILTTSQTDTGKDRLVRVVSMASGMIRHCENRIAEAAPDHGNDLENENEHDYEE